MARFFLLMQNIEMKCGNCGVHGPQLPLQLCTRCKLTCYCSKGCQVAHWGRHKLICKAASYLTKDSLHLTHDDWQNQEDFFSVRALVDEWRAFGPVPMQDMAARRPGAVAYADIERALSSLSRAAEKADVDDLEVLKHLLYERVPWILRRRAMDFLDKSRMQNVITRMQSPDPELQSLISYHVQQHTSGTDVRGHPPPIYTAQPVDYDNVLRSPLQASWGHRDIADIIDAHDTSISQLQSLRQGCSLVLRQVQGQMAQL